MGKVNFAVGIECLVPLAVDFLKKTGDYSPLKNLNTAIFLAKRIDEKIQKMPAEIFQAKQKKIDELEIFDTENNIGIQFLPAPTDFYQNDELLFELKQIKKLEKEALEIMGLIITEKDLENFRDKI